METNYTVEKNAEVVIALLKAHGIRRIIASPGSTNICFVGSVQSDPYFEVYSCVDERSAAYMACGMAEETGEPVVLSCTGATSSRNYMSALTEAYYRKLPVIAITSSQPNERIGHLKNQVTDRREMPADIVLMSVQVDPVLSNDGLWNCQIQVNKALTECRRNGGGPVHINLQTNNSRGFNVKDLPPVTAIKRVHYYDEFPELPEGKIVVFVGSHRTFSEKETKILDDFCASNDAVVFYEMTSGYKGAYGIKYDLIAAQEYFDSPFKHCRLMIQIGEMAGGDFLLQVIPQEVWRVNEDGVIRDTYKKLSYIFQMNECTFFEHYTSGGDKHDLYDSYKAEENRLYEKLKGEDLPFSNIWIAQQMSSRLPEDSEIHAGIMNSFRAWNLFELPKSVKSFCNVGGYGIDGCISAMVGASLIHPEKLYFGVFGDLAFFYDMNVIGNRHIHNNIRILLVNNGKGNEFHNHTQTWAKSFDYDYVDVFGSAAGHFGHKSPNLVKHYAEDLGFEYLTASDKDEFSKVVDRFLTPTLTDKPMLLEVFTEATDDSAAYKIVRRLIVDSKQELKAKVTDGIRQTIGDTKARQIKALLK